MNDDFTTNIFHDPKQKKKTLQNSENYTDLYFKRKTEIISLIWEVGVFPMELMNYVFRAKISQYVF